MLAPQAVKKPILSRSGLTMLIASSMTLGSLPILSQLLLGSPIDSRISFSINQLMMMATGMLFLLCIVIVIGSLFALAFSSNRRKALRTPLISLCVVVFVFCGLKGRFAIRTKQFEDLADRSRPLIAAIALYEKEHGRPPAKLELLVPKYISEVPHTGMGAYPDYEYKVSPIDPGLDAQWELSVPCSVGIANWDLFYYLPTEKYPKHDYGGYIEPIKNWAYVHE
jgi:hypothetical protein